MTTPRQVMANRKNAERSTGPSTDAGKAASSKNALWHGLTAKRFLLEGEDPNEFEQMRQGFHADFKPSGAMQEHIVDNLVDAFWRLRRVPAFEAALMEWHKYQYNRISGILPSEIARREKFEANLPRLDLRKALCEWMIPNDVFAKFSRYEAHLMRQIDAHLVQFRLLKDGFTASTGVKAIEGRATAPPPAEAGGSAKPLRAIDAVEIKHSLAPRGDSEGKCGPAG